MTSPLSGRNEAADNNNDDVPSPESMALGELKKELIDLGDSSFVFNDQTELIIALKAARRANGGGVNVVKSSTSSISSSSSSGGGNSMNSATKSSKNSVAAMTSRMKAVPEIPTMKEDDDLASNSGYGNAQNKGGVGGLLRKTRRVGRRNSLKSSLKTNNKRIHTNHQMVMEQKDESVRLVEYFVMVSSRERKPDPEDDTASSSQQPPQQRRRGPPDPTTDKLDPRTLSRFDARRAHLQGHDCHADNDAAVHLSSIANYSSMSTSSTCSSEDCDMSGRSGHSGSGDGGGGAMSGIRPSVNTSNLTGLSSSSENDEVEEYLLEPVITARYPAEDRKDQPLNKMLPQFCYPQGTDFIHPSREYKMPHIHHFVLTDSKAGKLYGTCLTVYEEFTPVNNNASGGDGSTSDGSQEVSATREGKTKEKAYYAPRVLCLLSTWPYLTSFRTYLTQLYRLATSTDLMEAPLERYILNICSEVPAPPPGAFEVRLSIMNNQIRFWAPPAQQPLAYVSLPYGILFECLDIGNIMFVWYTLACERKVLLVSDQLSLLTVCAEILSSLLFPMKWSHLYIPVLPRSLSPMLDAPMPYLCGISRENFAYAVPDIGDETVVVDLDRNVITVGPEAPELPPLPHKRRVKLEAALNQHAGDVFWNARGFTRQEADAVRRLGSAAATAEMKENAESLWCERIRTVDEAFNLAHAPDSTSILYNDNANADADEALAKQSRWDAIQEAFLRFYVAMLKEYRKFLPLEVATDTQLSWRGPDGNSELRFQTEEFVMSQRSDFQPFLEELTSTQQFDDFITKRIYNAGNEPDVAFFDQSIDAKKNRSKLKFKKADTTFLHSASAHRQLNCYDAVPPNRKDVPSSACSKIGTNGRPVYQYPIWPEKFNASLFGTARPIPTNITAEFERRIALKAKLKARTKELRARRNMSDDVTVSSSTSSSMLVSRIEV